MMPHPEKVREEHLKRKACIYIRQSSLAQVQNHQESTRRQYGLSSCALQLGWSDHQIEVIDQDLGLSASDAAQHRPGFQRLLTRVVTGEVGAVFSVEISRLARQDSEGHRLVEVAALTETLLIDEQQVYDPLLADDRLMLGLKVLLSSNEIRLMHQRLEENKLRKAQRGMLHFNLPVGLVFVPDVGVQVDPDEQVQGAVRLLFERFRLSGSLSTVVRYFRDNGLLYPRRKGCWHGPLEWDKLNLERVRETLANPLYAGAYVYGRTKRRLSVQPSGVFSRPRQLLPQEEWAVVHWNAFEGYLSREEFETNQTYLARNRTNHHIPNARSRRRDGSALLGGLLLCGRCGRPMHVGYQGTNGSRSVYSCNSGQIHFGESACQRIPGKAVDQFVTDKVLAALTPVQLELSLAVADELQRQQEELIRQWQRRLDAAQYAADLAQRRYEEVDPHNRLVACTLEHHWESRLQEVERLNVEFVAFCRDRPLWISPEQCQSLLNLSADLTEVWFAPTTSWTERKDLLKLLVADVTLTRHEIGITVQIRWFTNQVETGELPLPFKHGAPTPTIILERIRSLMNSHTDQEIADILNQEGIKTSRGNVFTARIVAHTRYRNRISRNSIPE
jgi:DNA invertase Pin-like site-specific DNA recombinase